MAAPSIKVCPEGAWTKVATSIAAGQLHTLITVGSGGESLVYLHTYRVTGAGAPTLVTEGVPLEGISHDIEFTANIDLYVWCLGAAGSVRVDT